MGQFRNSAYRYWDQRGDVPPILEHERRLCAVVLCPKLDWPVDLFAQDKDIAFKPLQKPRTEFHCACGCQQRHNCAISRVVAMGSVVRHVVWYRTMGSDYVRVRAASPEPIRVRGSALHEES
jgi:hypothetical protein